MRIAQCTTGSLKTFSEESLHERVGLRKWSASLQLGLLSSDKEQFSAVQGYSWGDPNSWFICFKVWKENLYANQIESNSTQRNRLAGVCWRRSSQSSRKIFREIYRFHRKLWGEGSQSCVMFRDQCSVKPPSHVKCWMAALCMQDEIQRSSQEHWWSNTSHDGEW
jgi:hypothetical protein